MPLVPLQQSCGPAVTIESKGCVKLADWHGLGLCILVAWVRVPPPPSIPMNVQRVRDSLTTVYCLCVVVLPLAKHPGL